MSKHKKNKRRMVQAAGLILLLPILLFVFIQTPPGKAFLAKEISAALSRSEGMTFQIKEISGWIPGNVSIRELSISDAEGGWLTGTGLHCRWQMSDLLNGTIFFRRLGAKELVLHRFPEPVRKEPRKPPREFTGFPELDFRIEGLNVKRLYLEKRVVGVPLSYSIQSGGINLLSDGSFKGDLTIDGDATGIVHLDAVLRGTLSDHLKLNAELVEMNYPTVGLDHLSGRAEALIDADGVDSELSLRLMLDDREGVFSTRLGYKERVLTFDHFKLTGRDNSCAGDLRLEFEPGVIQVKLLPTEINVYSNGFVVAGQGDVAISNKTWGVDLASLDITGWESVGLSLFGTIHPEEIDLKGLLTEMNVVDFPLPGASNFTGVVNGQLSVTGSLKRPNAVGGMSVRNFTSSGYLLNELPELDFTIEGGIKNGAMFATTSVTNSESGHLNADLSMPCEFSFSPVICLPDSEKLTAHLDADVNLENLNKLPRFQNQLISGIIKAKVSLEDGTPKGALKLTDGRYEHYDKGILFRDFNMMMGLSSAGFNILNASATDGGGGSVKVSGGYDFNTLHLQLDLFDAWVIRKDEVDAELSGHLNLGGPLFRPEIEGKLIVNRADILLDNIAPEPPKGLSDYHRDDTNAVAVAEEIIEKISPVGLNIMIEMPDQIFVNASMVEAVLGGNIHLSDTPEGISVKGNIQPRRGFVSFVGKKFRFTEGEITMDGSVPTVAMLDNLTAEYSRSDMTARLILNGRAEDPDIRLESTPAMPEDEILSHVLFNRDTSSISPYQAYQIAVAARQLANGLSGPGFMYQLRKAVGVDTLEWREGEGTGDASSVAAGKYITTGLYIEVNRSVEEQGQTGMSAEYEVSRHFSIETYTGPQMRPGIGINWRKDY